MRPLDPRRVRCRACMRCNATLPRFAARRQPACFVPAAATLQLRPRLAPRDPEDPGNRQHPERERRRPLRLRGGGHSACCMLRAAQSGALLQPRCASVQAGPRPPCPVWPSPQTVPSCQALYKNSFVYHTVSASPPPLEECCAFLGACRSPRRHEPQARRMLGVRAEPSAAMPLEFLFTTPLCRCPLPSALPWRR